MMTMTTRTRHPAGTPTGGQFAPDAHAEPEVTLSTPESTPETSENGTTRWFDGAGRLHRTDGPAVEYASGAWAWFAHGKRHRPDGLPAALTDDGTLEWYAAGFLHRDGGPAVVYPTGTTIWCRHGRFHRTDGPAVERADGSQEWWIDGQEVEPPPASAS